MESAGTAEAAGPLSRAGLPWAISMARLWRDQGTLKTVLGITGDILAQTRRDGRVAVTGLVQPPSVLACCGSWVIVHRRGRIPDLVTPHPVKSGLVPMSPDTTPNAERLSARRLEVTALALGCEVAIFDKRNSNVDEPKAYSALVGKEIIRARIPVRHLPQARGQ